MTSKICRGCGESKTMDNFYLIKRENAEQRARCKTCNNTTSRQYRQDNLEARRAYEKEYFKNNVETRRAYANAYNKELSQDTRQPAMLHHLFYTGELSENRLKRAEKIIGCKRSHYRCHLKSIWKRCMFHDAYGSWLIDLVVPKIAFKGTLAANLHMVFWWGNVQALWEHEKREKGDTYTEEDKQSLITRYTAWKAAGSPRPRAAIGLI